MSDGQKMYEAYRQAWNRAARRRAHQAGLPRWKDLKPWVKRVWCEAADV